MREAKELRLIPYEIDPSLHGAQPAPPVLDDGFSPPPLPPEDEAGNGASARDSAPLPPKSPY